MSRAPGEEAALTAGGQHQSPGAGGRAERSKQLQQREGGRAWEMEMRATWKSRALAQGLRTEEGARVYAEGHGPQYHLEGWPWLLGWE